MEEKNKIIESIKSKFKSNFSNKGLTQMEIDIKMLEIDVSFLLHVQINDAFSNMPNIKNRLDLYIQFLENELKHQFE